jgi:HEPN domain-containing protein
LRFPFLSKAINDLPQSDRELDILIDIVKEEIKSKMFLFIPSQWAKYYEWHLPGELIVYFPNASKEMNRAGRCYAKGEFTACVFHSMRAAELCLRALASHLNVTFPFPIDLADWHNLITNIESVIKKIDQQPKSTIKNEEMKFCSAAASQFRYFKEAYRKHVMHVRETYNEEEVLSIMERTAEFLKGLAGKITDLEP